ncbi:TetR family transcriptional regulator [Kribbella sp. NPDC049174]|uniref:TetR family transcriptional regulator n=1 Tax=Kribbella sp. NPDC049174 TaxID=3364112 RepID=UPI003713E6A6
MAEHVAAATDARATIGRRVRQLRMARGVSLRRLAADLEVSPATLSAVENGRTGVDAVRLAQIAGLLDVPVEQLFPAASTDVPQRSRRAALAQAVATEDWRRYPPLELDAPLAGALAAFLEVGYHGATIRDIAHRAGLSVPGLYHHYASKQEMLVAILDLTMDDLQLRMVAARSEGRDPVERFALLVECLALFHTHRRELGFVGASEMRGLEPAAYERVAAARRAVQRMVDAEVELAAQEGAFTTPHAHEAARAVVTMCTAMSQWFQAGGPASAEDVAQLYVDLALELVGNH